MMKSEIPGIKEEEDCLRGVGGGFRNDLIRWIKVLLVLDMAFFVALDFAFRLFGEKQKGGGGKKERWMRSSFGGRGLR